MISMIKCTRGDNCEDHALFDLSERECNLKFKTFEKKCEKVRKSQISKKHNRKGCELEGVDVLLAIKRK